MRTIEKTLYKYDELSDKAKEKALRKHQEDFEFWQGSEVLDTLKKAIEYYDFKLTDYSIDWRSKACSSVDIKDNGYFVDEDGEDLTNEALAEYIRNNYSTYLCPYQKKYRPTYEGNCPFTGVCYDEEFLDPIRSFLEKPANITIDELLEECIDTVLTTAQNEYEACLEEDYFREECTSNDYEFYEDGTLY